jgi:hypothetical protein
MILYKELIGDSKPALITDALKEAKVRPDLRASTVGYGVLGLKEISLEGI